MCRSRMERPKTVFDHATEGNWGGLVGHLRNVMYRTFFPLIVKEDQGNGGHEEGTAAVKKDSPVIPDPVVAKTSYNGDSLLICAAKSVLR